MLGAIISIFLFIVLIILVLKFIGSIVKSIVILVIIGVILFFFYSQISDGFSIFKDVADKDPEPVVCAMDVFICPDGTAVSRIPPDCDFEECPDNHIRILPIDKDLIEE